jgi:predicted nucleotidyltransferase
MRQKSIDLGKKLQATNRIQEFRKIAESLKLRISRFEGVSGIMYLGGLVRGFADRFSDVDIMVLLSQRDEILRKKIKKIGLDEHRRSGVDIDLEVHFVQDFRSWKWNEMKRWDFSRSQIVYDPEGKVGKLFKRRLKVPDVFWLERIVIYGEYLRWYCCPSRRDVGTIAETWVDRGDLISAHYCLNYALGLLVKVVFALNKEFLPPPKWEIFYSYTLKWLPHDYKKLVTEILTVRSFSKDDLDRRLKATRRLWRSILLKIHKEMGLTSESISKKYVKKVLDQK